MTDRKARAAALLREFKGDRYVFGLGCFDQLGRLTAPLGKRVSVVAGGVGKSWGGLLHEAVEATLQSAGLQLAGGFIAGAAPNAPREDVFRIARSLAAQKPDAVVALGGGSAIDAAKAAAAYWTLGGKYPSLDDYFGVGQIARMLQAAACALPPLAAVQTAAGSAAHLTKYSNITDIAAGQKMLIVDETIVPPRALFDYQTTVSSPPDLTMDGGLDGVSHCLEVYFGLPQDKAQAAREVCLLGIDLIVGNLKKAVANPGDLDVREALGLGTDLGGYAITIGGTNGAHLNSFSLTDLFPHGRACALLNPYYTVFFAPAIESRIRDVGAIYKAAGYTGAKFERLSGRAAGLALARAMIAHSKDIGFPTTLRETPGFTPAHIERALSAAKNPKLEIKLRNMPVPLSVNLVDEYMRPVLEAAANGDFNLIRNMP